MAQSNPLTRWSHGIVRKAASLFFPREIGFLPNLFFGPGRTTYNYAADVQDGLMSSVVMPVVHFMMRAFPEAPLVVRHHQGDALEIVASHPLVQLVNRPNLFYSGTILWMATVMDWCLWGESYWRILRSRGGQPSELWWIPPWSVKPKWPDDGSVFISHYEYQPSVGIAIRLPIDDIVHFRHGLDPRNMRHGLPPLRAIIQDIWVDAESNNLVGAMLRNMGIPGLILSPKGDERLSQTEVELVKAYISSRFTGDQRGQPLALGGPTDVHRLSLSPAEFDMAALRSTAEERVSATFGISAAVVGFKSGLENSKVGATMAEFVKLSWSNGIVPIQRIMAGELQQKLLPLFEDDPDASEVGWDYDEVKALEQDQNELAKRAVDLFQGGVLMRSESRQIMGYEANDGDEIYLVPSMMTEEGPDAPEPAPLPLPPASPIAQSANGTGNGNGSQQSARVVQQRSNGHSVQKAIPDETRVLKADDAAIRSVANRLEPRLRAQFLAAIASLKANIDDEALNEALRMFSGDLAIEAIPWEVFAERFGHETTLLLREAAGSGGMRAAQQLSERIGFTMRFDLTNPSAISWAEQYAGRLVQGITTRTQEAIKGMVSSSLQGNLTWQQVSRLVGEVVGLDERRAVAVQNFEIRLQSEGVAPARIEARVARYAQAQLRGRADNIARTEIMTAANQGAQLAWNQAALQGFINASTTSKTWIITPDDALCPICEDLDGDVVALNGVFSGGYQQPPAHPQCRCTTGLVFEEQAASPLGLPAVAAVD